MADLLSEKCKVTVSDDGMSATLFIEPPSDGIAYSVETLSSFLKTKGVYGGVIYSALEEMTQNNIYNEDYVVARGQLPTQGHEGYFEVFFDSNTKRKPIIRSDGSVDYQSMSDIPMVRAGEVLAKYHPAKQGTHGVDVRGRTLRAAPCKDMAPIKGKGFSYNPDTGVYTSDIEGKIEYDGKTLNIQNVYELKGDLDLVAGKIDFRGDVIVKGNVKAGTVIRATKTITIEGSVESATLISGGDIVLKKGMQGGKKARISCGGDLYASFIEFADIDVKGKVEANIIMNCNVSAGTDIKVSGKKGAIVGGKSYAVGRVSSSFLGNVAGHKTLVSVGVKQELKDREKVLKSKLLNVSRSIENTNKEIIKVTDSRLSQDSKAVQAAKLSQLKRRLVRDERLKSHVEEELSQMDDTLRIGKGARIEALSNAFVGTKIVIDDLVLPVEKDYKKVEFVRDDVEDIIRVIE